MKRRNACSGILQEELRPILLRRMKEDVENLPEKEEVVVWVQLTHQQRSYYKALYSNQVSPCIPVNPWLFLGIGNTVLPAKLPVRRFSADVRV